MPSQTKTQKEAEAIYRKRVLGQRFKGGLFNHNYKYGDKDYYISHWVLPQISRFKKFLTKIGYEKIEDKTILELGAESGHIASFICNNYKPKIVIASDIAKSLCEAVPFIASCLNFTRYPKMMILDNYQLPFKNESFDLIFGVSVLHHVPDPFLILKEVNRVLKNRGLAIFHGEPFLPKYLLPLQFLYSRFDKKQGICESVFTLKDWFSFIKDFKIIDMQFDPPSLLENIFPQNSFMYRYFTGGGLGFILEKK